MIKYVPFIVSIVFLFWMSKIVAVTQMKEIAIIFRFGIFYRIAGPGFVLFLWPIDKTTLTNNRSLVQNPGY